MATTIIEIFLKIDNIIFNLKIMSANITAYVTDKKCFGYKKCSCCNQADNPTTIYIRHFQGQKVPENIIIYLNEFYLKNVIVSLFILAFIK